MVKVRSAGVGTIRNLRGKNPSTPIRMSQLLLGGLGCVFVACVFLFSTSLHLMTRSNTGNNNPQHDNNKAEQHHHHAPEHYKPLKGAPTPISLEAAQAALLKAKKEFYDRYGGQATADSYYQTTITAFGDVQKTANRILRAIAQQDDFVMGFAGYSITVGRGNFFHQSFPFVVERALKEPMKALGVSNLVVRNSAIGGIPSFPYAYCLDHFVSKDTDILSWDFSMNEKSKDPAVFEAYVRQALHQLPKQPMIIMVDNNPLRTKLLADYVEQGLLQGALTVAKADAVLDKALLAKPDNEKPPGLQKWEEFGAPDGCPGKGSWHPKKQEHEFMGWMIARHFLDALQIVFQTQQANPTSWYKPYAQTLPKARAIFPKPMSTAPENDASVTEILFGHHHPTAEGLYQMKQLSCRTNFLPATDSTKVLETLVASGRNTLATADNIMDERSNDYYQKGWVLDVSQVERDTKRKVERCGGLGYIDMKIALYGIPASGTLELFLPYEGEPHSHDHDDATDAQHWYDGVIVCEANDKRPKEACQLDRDIDYVVGGVAVPSVVMINGAGEYLKRKTCVNIGVPPGAQTSQRNNQMGLSVQITAKGAVNRKDGACCISHVVWEQH